MEGKWTKGEWYAEGLCIKSRNENRTIVCEVTGSTSNPSTQADLRLIAQAPAMADALEKVARFLWEEGYTTVNPIVAEVDALLTAIKGE